MKPYQPYLPSYGVGAAVDGQSPCEQSLEDLLRHIVRHSKVLEGQIELVVTQNLHLITTTAAIVVVGLSIRGCVLSIDNRGVVLRGSIKLNRENYINGCGNI